MDRNRKMSRILLKLIACIFISLFFLAYACNDGKLFDKKRFYPNGELFQEYEVNSDSLKVGSFKEYYKNGQVKYIKNYVCGKENGYYKAFNDDGSLFEYGSFISGKMNGKWTLLNNNTVKFLNYYNAGLLDSSIVFDNNGAFLRKVFPGVIESKYDTIKAGTKFSGKIVLRYVNDFSNSKFTLFCSRNEDANIIGRPIPAVKFLRGEFKNDYNFDIQVDTPGIYLIHGEVIFNEPNKKENSSIFNHRFTVVK